MSLYLYFISESNINPYTLLKYSLNSYRIRNNETIYNYFPESLIKITLISKLHIFSALRLQTNMYFLNPFKMNSVIY